MRADRRSHRFECQECLCCTVCGIALRDALEFDRPCRRTGRHAHPGREGSEPYVPEWAIPLAAAMGET